MLPGHTIAACDWCSAYSASMRGLNSGHGGLMWNPSISDGRTWCHPDGAKRFSTSTPDSQWPQPDAFQDLVVAADCCVPSKPSRRVGALPAMQKTQPNLRNLAQPPCPFWPFWYDWDWRFGNIMTSLKATWRGNLGRFISVGSSYHLVENLVLTFKVKGKEVELESSRPPGPLLHLVATVKSN